MIAVLFQTMYPGEGVDWMSVLMVLTLGAFLLAGFYCACSLIAEDVRRALAWWRVKRRLRKRPEPKSRRTGEK